LKKAAIIINPVSGISNKEMIREIIHRGVDKTRFRHEILFSEYAGHAYQVSKQCAKEGYDMVVAVGGDGSVNEVGHGLVNTSTSMGIIPTGSGNGLAGFLKIPSSLSKAMECINTFRNIKIDTANLNQHFFCNMAGTGFDARVSEKFSRVRRRGFWSYFKIIMSEYPSFEARNYKLLFKEQVLERRAMMINFANSNQFGNNAVIAPNAKINDGLLDVCIVSKVSLLEAPLFGQVLMLKLMDRTHYVEFIKASEITVLQETEEVCHTDGDPVNAGKNLKVKVNPLSLNVIVPPKK